MTKSLFGFNSNVRAVSAVMIGQEELVVAQFYRCMARRHVSIPWEIQIAVLSPICRARPRVQTVIPRQPPSRI